MSNSSQVPRFIGFLNGHIACTKMSILFRESIKQGQLNPILRLKQSSLTLNT